MTTAITHHALGDATTDGVGAYEPGKSFLDNYAQLFKDASAEYLKKLDDSIKKMGAGDTTNPGVLADYQKASTMWTMQLNAESAFFKSVRDNGMGVIHNF